MATAHSALVAAPGSTSEDAKKTRIGITSCDVTAPCVSFCRGVLEGKYGYEIQVFEADGQGSQAMEKLVEAGELDAVLDITTREVCDYIMDGTSSAGPTRLEAATAAGIPYVLSLGAANTTNFGPHSTVPPKYHDRQLYPYGPLGTLMRTNVEEAVAVGDFIASKLKVAVKPRNVHLVIPNDGLCMLSVPSGPLSDPKADMAMFLKIKDDLTDTSVKVLDDHRDINDSGFAEDISERLVKIIKAQ